MNVLHCVPFHITLLSSRSPIGPSQAVFGGERTLILDLGHLSNSFPGRRLLDGALELCVLVEAFVVVIR